MSSTHYFPNITLTSFGNKKFIIQVSKYVGPKPIDVKIYKNESSYFLDFKNFIFKKDHSIEILFQFLEEEPEELKQRLEVIIQQANYKPTYLSLSWNAYYNYFLNPNDKKKLSFYPFWKCFIKKNERCFISSSRY